MSEIERTNVPEHTVADPAISTGAPIPGVDTVEHAPTGTSMRPPLHWQSGASGIQSALGGRLGANAVELLRRITGELDTESRGGVTASAAAHEVAQFIESGVGDEALVEGLNERGDRIMGAQGHGYLNARGMAREG